MASTLFIASFAVFLTFTFLTPSTSTEVVSRLDVLGWVCNNGSVPDLEAYRRSYQINIDKTRDDMRNLKFGTHEDGVPPQKMYFLSQCVSDLSPDECSLCWSRATDLLFNCFPSPGGRFYLDGCFVRADNYSFYREPVTRQDTKICGGDESSSSREFKGLVKEVTKSIVDTAPYSQGFSVVARKSVHGLTAYGLGICRQTLDDELCQLCLADGALSATSCSPATEAFVMNAGCYLRYSNYTFYNERELLSMSLTKEHVLRILVISMVCVLAIASGFWCGKCIYLGASSKKKLKEKESKSVSNNSNLMCFKYSTLEKATNNFNESCKLGVGGYGEVFKGTLSDGREIAIKRLHISGNKTREEIHNEIDVISRCQHKNLVRLIDFGLAKFYPEGGKDIPSSSPSPSPIAGTLGYMAPEYISKGILSNKIDAYSFGVLVLEITSGFRNNKFRSDNSLETLVTQVWKCYASDKMEEMIDKDMEEETDKTEVKRVMQIGLLCTQESPQLRPTMSKVIEMINSTDLVLPTPTKPPFLHDSM
ncbi:hypothetical protein F2Q70_00034440 [Brassica cretica]|uniref:Cysteine-rich receptor-like protein kinase 43 n=1 Tax=Brassica cretica TaxID=69181 RepID=A0A8S9GEX8_BRACR|nr:hypothetical protein F2Q68_00029323 [Brassica cretica]KAF2586247.1 hypothetical protein F2Q70_00034440 [Brassica cretica]